jgi:hypothetical protein
MTLPLLLPVASSCAPAPDPACSPSAGPPDLHRLNSFRRFASAGGSPAPSIWSTRHSPGCQQCSTVQRSRRTARDRLQLLAPVHGRGPVPVPPGQLRRPARQHVRQRRGTSDPALVDLDPLNPAADRVKANRASERGGHVDTDFALG